jgi:plastocyanin
VPAYRIGLRQAATAVFVSTAAMGACHARHATAYVPRTRAVTITTVPLLVKEQQRIFPFLARDFAAGGVLSGKEVYAFVPSTLVVYEGDTLRLTFVNPEDDEHSFVLPDLFVRIRGQSTTDATWIARRAGMYEFTCSIPSHLPMMSGQLVVLPPPPGAER